MSIIWYELIQQLSMHMIVYTYNNSASQNACRINLSFITSYLILSLYCFFPHPPPVLHLWYLPPSSLSPSPQFYTHQPVFASPLHFLSQFFLQYPQMNVPVQVWCEYKSVSALSLGICTFYRKRDKKCKEFALSMDSRLCQHRDFCTLSSVPCTQSSSF